MDKERFQKLLAFCVAMLLMEGIENDSWATYLAGELYNQL